MDVNQRQQVERLIVRAAVDGLLAAGYSVSVCDGDAWPVERSVEAGAVMAGLFACDAEWLHVYKADGPDFIGSVLLVYSNNGYDVIADHSISLTDALGAADNLADLLGDAILFGNLAEQLEQLEKAA